MSHRRNRTRAQAIDRLWPTTVTAYPAGHANPSLTASLALVYTVSQVVRKLAHIGSPVMTLWAIIHPTRTTTKVIPARANSTTARATKYLISAHAPGGKHTRRCHARFVNRVPINEVERPADVVPVSGVWYVAVHDILQIIVGGWYVSSRETHNTLDK